MATVSKITELDFDQVKADLKQYLKSQDRFKDYDFEASNMNILLDVLAYNTFQNNYYTNMAISEMFMDSAQLRDSVVSHSKTLGYIPSSRASARARVNVTLSVAAPYPNFITIPAKTKFLARCGNLTYAFYNHESVTITPINNRYTYYGLDIYEGKYVSEAIQVTGLEDQRFIISNKNIDTSSIRVTVKDSTSDTGGTEYTVRTNLFGVEPTDNVFYLQAYFGERYEITFGKNLFGNQPINGNVIVIEYRTTVGEEANGITSFSPASQIQGYNGQCTLISKSAGGAEKESVESIKFFAPKSVQVQDRAVTESDYEILLRNNFPEVQAVSVYGGEELDPPRYGRVAVAVDVFDATGVSNNNKVRYYNYLKERCPIGIEPIIISPEFMYLSVTSNVTFNTKKTSLSAAAVKALVTDAILNYGTENLSQFKTTFRYSSFINAIDNAHSDIISNDTDVLAIIPWGPALNTSTGLKVSFKNRFKIDHPLTAGELIATHKPAIKSSTFTYNNSTAFLQDDGEGNLMVLRATTDGSFVYLNRNVGSVNYLTGEVVISNFQISAYSGSELKLYGRLFAKDITPPKNRILTIRESDLNVNVFGTRN